MEYLEIGKLIATAVIFTFIGWSLNRTKTNKKLLAKSEEFGLIINDLHERIFSEFQASKHERAKMLINQTALDNMIKENKELNRQILLSIGKKKVPQESNEAEQELNSLKNGIKK